MATISLTNIVFNSDLESATVNSIFAEIENFLNGTTASADVTITGTMTAAQFQTAADGTGPALAGSYTMGAGDDAGIYWDGADIVTAASTALTNTIQYLSVKHTTSGTPAAGIGVGLKALVETSASNNEIGALIDLVTTDVSAASEDFDFVVKLMAGGSSAAEKFRVSSAALVTTTSINLSSSTTVSSILDEDDMSSDSATALSTQQSIKKYVDDQIATINTWQEVMDNGNTFYTAVNDGNPEARIGATDAEELHIQTVFDSGAQTLDYVLFQTDAASATADKGEYRFNVDGTVIAHINDSGINVLSGLDYAVADTSVLNGTTLGAGVVNSSLTNVGTLTTLIVDDITINGNTISSAGASSLTMTATAGQNVSIELVTFDGGVVATPGYLKISADGTAPDAGGSLTLGAGDDAGIFFDGTNLVVITDGAGASGIILDSEDDTLEIKGSGTLQATFDTGGLNLVTGDTYEINATSVLSATTLGSGVVNSSLTNVGTLTTLTVDTVTINGNAITSSAASSLTLTALAGQTVLVESVFFDSGVMGGVSNLTMTGTLDLGTNTILDGAMTGDWVMNGTDISDVDTIVFSDARVLTINAGNTGIIKKGSAGGWSFFHFQAEGSAGTVLGGWGSNGSTDGLTSWFLGTEANKRMIVLDSGSVGMNVTPTAPLHVDQPSTTAATPVMKLDQGDTSEPFVDFIGTSAGDANSSISSLTSAGATIGFVQVDVNGAKGWVEITANPT